MERSREGQAAIFATARAVERLQQHQEPDDLLAELAGLHELIGGELTRTLIDDARRAGASWSDVGRAFDITRQAAQQRLGHSDDTAGQ